MLGIIDENKRNPGGRAGGENKQKVLNRIWTQFFPLQGRAKEAQDSHHGLDEAG